jgi:hypothetical protein
MTFINSQFERRVAVPASTANVSITGALRELGFDISSQQLTLIEARRGSTLAVAALPVRRFKKLPLTATVRLTPTETHECSVSVSLQDDWNRAVLGLPLGVNGAYAHAFEDAQQAIDAALMPGGATSDVRPAVVETRQANIRFYERANEALNRLGELAVSKGNSVLAGDGIRARGGPPDLIEEVNFERDDLEARLSRLEVQAMLTAGGLIAMHPGSMPDALRADVERFVARVERALTDGRDRLVVVPVVGDELSVVKFLRQQALIRENLDVRTLRVCKTCAQRKIINPDFQRLLKRNKRLRLLGGGFGASISSSGITPFVLVGTFLRNASLDPDFVCGRCQGLRYDDALVTFCPKCGDMREEVVLQICRKCRHDFRATLPHEELWVERCVFSGGIEGNGAAPADWYPDPLSRHEHRYWDGSRWTDHAADAGRQITDPI